MIGRDVAFVAKKKESLAPGKVCVVFREQGIETARSRATGERYCEPSALRDCRATDADEFFCGGVKEIGGCGQNFNNPNASHRGFFAQSFLWSVLRLAKAGCPRDSRRGAGATYFSKFLQARLSRSSNSSASFGPQLPEG